MKGEVVGVFYCRTTDRERAGLSLSSGVLTLVRKLCVSGEESTGFLVTCEEKTQPKGY